MLDIHTQSQLRHACLEPASLLFSRILGSIEDRRLQILGSTEDPRTKDTTPSSEERSRLVGEDLRCGGTPRKLKIWTLASAAIAVFGHSCPWDVNRPHFEQGRHGRVPTTSNSNRPLGVLLLTAFRGSTVAPSGCIKTRSATTLQAREASF